MDADKDRDMDMDTQTTTSQSNPSILLQPQPQPPPTTTTTITLLSLPTEILLQILSTLLLPVLLRFRLVSKCADTLVLEPVFWHRLEFSKQLLFKTGWSNTQQRLQHRRTSFGLTTGATLPGTRVGVAGGGGGERRSMFQHHSDANLIVHRQSLAAALLSPSTRAEDSWTAAAAAAAAAAAGLEVGPSLTFSGNIPLLPPAHHQQSSHHQQGVDTLSTTSPTSPIAQQLQKTSPWTKIETSFMNFLTRLTTHPRTAYGVRTIIIEDWEGVESVQVLWTMLGAFSQLRTLVFKKSVLRHIRGHPHHNGDIRNENGDKGEGRTSWPELKELDFQDCVHLKDLEGIHIWLPHLQDLSLAGCTAIDDFLPLTRPLPSSPASPSTSSRSEVLTLKLKRASFIHTKIQDEELISLLRRSPELEELRLDQCYGLTVRALEAIAFGNQSTVTSGELGQAVGVPGLAAAPAPAPTVASAEGNTGYTVIPSSQEAQLTSPYHFTTTTTNNYGITGSPHASAGPSQLLNPLPTSTISPSITSSSSPSASTLTSVVPHPHPHTFHHPSTTEPYCPQLRKLSLKNCYDLTDEGIRSLVGCRHLEWLVIRGIRQVNEDTAEWLHSQGVPLRTLLSPLGRWRYWHV
jgi:hypothetical protein